jgi:MFS family permease
VLLQPFAVLWVKEFRRSRVLAVSALLVGFGFSINAFARSLPGYALSIAVWTLGEILLSPVAPAVVSDLSPPRLRGTYQGLYQMSWGGAFCLAPLVGAFALGRFGPVVLWTSCAALGCAVAVLHLAIAPLRRRRLLELSRTTTEPSLPAEPALFAG